MRKDTLYTFTLNKRVEFSISWCGDSWRIEFDMVSVDISEGLAQTLVDNVGCEAFCLSDAANV